VYPTGITGTLVTQKSNISTISNPSVSDIVSIYAHAATPGSNRDVKFNYTSNKDKSVI